MRAGRDDAAAPHAGDLPVARTNGRGRLETEVGMRKEVEGSLVIACFLLAVGCGGDGGGPADGAAGAGGIAGGGVGGRGGSGVGGSAGAVDLARFEGCVPRCLAEV